jgi:hypothetical protein
MLDLKPPLLLRERLAKEEGKCLSVFSKPIGSSWSKAKRGAGSQSNFGKENNSNAGLKIAAL